jgi:hypothetical protein
MGAHQIVKKSVEEKFTTELISKVMAAMGKKGGKIGGNVVWRR